MRDVTWCTCYFIRSGMGLNQKPHRVFLIPHGNQRSHKPGMLTKIL